MIDNGQKLPEFTLENQDGQSRTNASYAGKWLVLYIYPKDDTPGCTVQGKAFTATKSDFDARRRGRRRPQRGRHEVAQGLLQQVLVHHRAPRRSRREAPRRARCRPERVQGHAVLGPHDVPRRPHRRRSQGLHEGRSERPRAGRPQGHRRAEEGLNSRLQMTNGAEAHRAPPRRPPTRRRQARAQLAFLKMSMTSWSSLSPSARGRWKALRPMIEPNAPPSARPFTSSSSARGVAVLAAREDDDALAVEGALDAVTHAVGERLDRHVVLLEDLLRLGLLDVRRRRLDLDDVRAELRGDLRRVRRHVDRRLAFLGETGAARIGPHDRRRCRRPSPRG